ncbi:UDP-N-acetylglucosamine 1-carboxyvinyltransferase [Hallerella succinigenes]|uniref:UDP-N-acetylglucosamine 1-carboxyvinyltransferase n=1 Tax=Hallerella succinigenes TaxID=1896222 RepID=A0A2M9A8S4_9BACT|nr:UDP-N-acetylglucosamine 1-carboxyvinyltransferase [Hallerella succinigenes]PJJ42119.1 UDP-N-acetylglucosamine 1-carboxyvinyltransferase [Hallerella succinigenes]
MDSFSIVPTGKPLSGEVEISGAKNAVLATMTAAMLADGVTTITNVPYLRDTKTMSNVLRVIGCRIDGGPHEFKVDTHGANHLEAPYELVSTMRASFYVLGPLVSRFGRCRVSLPGGCAWGPRPVDLHLKGLEALGANIEVTHGYVEATSNGRLPGGNFRFPISSVGATVNVLMAATLAKGTSVLENAAIEPEIDSLVDLLLSMGVKIEGRGTRSLVVHGVEEMHPGFSETIPDRIEAGSFLCGAVISRGKVKTTKCDPIHIKSLLDIFEEMGCIVHTGKDWAEVDASSRDLKPVHVEAVPYPGFPTDLQAPLMAVLATVPGESKIRDTVYIDRFKHVAELNRLGANISLEGNTATIKGVEKLQGAPVMASDLRAAAALVIAGLVADGETRVSRIYHLDRGYENFEAKMAKLGGMVVRLSDQS